METNKKSFNGERSIAATGECSQSLSSVGLYQGKGDLETPALRATPGSVRSTSRDLSENLEKAPELKTKRKMSLGVVLFVLLALTGGLIAMSIAFFQLQSKYEKLEKSSKPDANDASLKSDFLSESERAGAKAMLTRILEEHEHLIFHIMDDMPEVKKKDHDQNAVKGETMVQRGKRRAEEKAKLEAKEKRMVNKKLKPEEFRLELIEILDELWQNPDMHRAIIEVLPEFLLDFLMNPEYEKIKITMLHANRTPLRFAEEMLVDAMRHQFDQEKFEKFQNKMMEMVEDVQISDLKKLIENKDLRNALKEAAKAIAVFLGRDRVKELLTFAISFGKKMDEIELRINQLDSDEEQEDSEEEKHESQKEKLRKERSALLKNWSEESQKLARRAFFTQSATFTIEKAIAFVTCAARLRADQVLEMAKEYESQERIFVF